MGWLAEAMTRAGRSVGWRSDEAPVADGGEGILDVLGGKRRSTRVQGPLGEVVAVKGIAGAHFTLFALASTTAGGPISRS